MKPTVLHGENTVGSRNKLSSLIDEFTNKGYEVARLDKPTNEELGLSIRSVGLFSEKRLLVVEKLFENHKDAFDLLESIEKTLKSNFDLMVVFWENKSLPPTTVKKLNTIFTVQEFKLPSTLFILLDNLRPNNASSLLKNYHDSAKKIEADLLFAMLARQTRLLLWVKLDPETTNLPSWQKGKLQSQASKFTEEELTLLNKKLLEIDRAYKTSKLPEDLSSSLQLLFASI